MSKKLVLCLFFATSAFAQDLRLDERILKEIKAAELGGPYQLSAESGVKTSSRRRFEESKGYITIRGKVASSADRRRVEEVALSVPGVNEVVMDVEVDPALGTFSLPSDSEVKKIRQALKRVPLAEAAEIRVRSDGHGFRLEGVASSAKEKMMLGEAARAASPAARLENAVIVASVPDEELKNRVSRVMAENGVAVDGLSFHTRDGVVTVGGERKKHEEVDRILSLLLMVPGVSDIRSEVRIGP